MIYSFLGKNYLKSEFYAQQWAFKCVDKNKGISFRAVKGQEAQYTFTEGEKE